MLDLDFEIDRPFEPGDIITWTSDLALAFWGKQYVDAKNEIGVTLVDMPVEVLGVDYSNGNRNVSIVSNKEPYTGQAYYFADLYFELVRARPKPEEVKSYRTDMYGFQTCDENWETGKWLI